MARLDIPVSVIKRANQGPFDNDDLEITETAAQDAGSGGNKSLAAKMNRFRFRNSGSTPRAITIYSVADPNTGRTGDITATIAAGKVWEIDVPGKGFKQTSGADKGSIKYDCAHAEVLVSVNHL